jgi:hypothetical protein
MSDDDEQRSGFGAFGIPLPAEIASAIVSQHERSHMRQEMAIMEVQNFLESLSVPQLLTLRRILCADNECAPNQFYDGQIYQIMRLMHHVDPDTGDSFDEQLGSKPAGA